jgi:hypothetical protein
MSILRVLWLTGVLFSGTAGSVEVYRCMGESGEPAFRQRPCDTATSTIPTSPVRSAPPDSGLRASERAWLNARQAKSRAAPGSRSGNRNSPKRAGPDAARKASQQAYRCRQKRRALDAVKSKLRRGYKPAQGEKLRRRRRSHEDYLAAYCP